MHFASLRCQTACFEELVNQRKIWLNIKYIYCIDTDDIQGFFLLLKNHIFTARSEDTIFITCEDIGVTMATNVISHLQESFPLRRAAGSFEISFTRSCLLCRNFISIYKINRKLHSRLVIRPLSSRAESIFNSYIHYSILSCFILMVYYRKDSRPRRIFTTV